MDDYKKNNAIEMALDHILLWSPVHRDYKNKERQTQVWEDIDTKIRPPAGDFSSPAMGFLQVAPTGCNNSRRTNARGSLYVSYVILV